MEAPHPSSLVPHPSSLASELRAFLRERLAEALVPATYVLLEALPLTPSGKVDRQALPAPDGAGPAPRQPFVAPRDAWEQQLAGLWARLLAVQPIGVNDDFFELGGHSLLAARLLLEIEAIWGRRLSLAALLPAPTIARVASLLREAGDPAPWRSLVPIRPAGARPPLFFVHGIGGGVLGYRELARHLPPNQPFYGLQSPGLAGLPVTAARVEEMAARYLAEIRSVQPVGPYSLGGFSFGGLVAFEMARQLEAQAEAVALLALVDTDGPPPVRSLTVAARRLLGRARRVGKGTPRGAPPGDPLARALREVEQAHRQALAAYVPRAYAGRITLFRARERPAAADPALGWGQVAAGGVEVREVPGDHLSMVEYPHLLTLARELSECLEAAQAAGVGRSGVQAFRRSGPVMDEHEHEHEHDPNPRMPERPNA